MFHYSLRVIDEPKISEIRILNLCHKKTILVDIYRQSLLNIAGNQNKNTIWAFLLYSLVLVITIFQQNYHNDQLVVTPNEMTGLYYRD